MTDQHRSDGIDGEAHAKETTVFLSYSRDDQKRALPIIRLLEQNGYSVWWDGMLEGGERFARTTDAALQRAKAVVVLWSKSSIGSHWVHDEATQGRDRRCLVPLSIDGSQPPLGFRQFQVIDAAAAKVRAGSPEMLGMLRAVAALHDRPIDAHGGKPARLPVFNRRAVIAGGTVVAVLGGGGAVWKTGLLSGSLAQNSIAVLPFANMSGDASQQYFSDGLSEELRATLSLNQQLIVAAQMSSINVQELKLDVKDIAGQLDVAYILDGSVRRAAGILRITAKLIDGATGFQKWSQTFDRKSDDIFAVQSEIAIIVADQLAVTISAGSKRQKRGVGSTKDAQSYDAYLQGKALYKLAADEQSDRAALLQFGRAIKRDPGFAAAFAAKSRALTVIANNYATGGELKNYYAQAIDAARGAVKLAPDLADAHSALGFALFNGQLDVKGANEPYQKSKDLGFGNADILSGFANYATRTGQFDAARQAIKRAQRLDPLNPSVHRNAGVIEYSARNFDAALGPLQSALRLNPKISGVYPLLGDMKLLSGDADSALANYSKIAGGFDRLKGLAIAHDKLGKRELGQAAMAEMIAEFGDNSLYQQAQVLAQWGEYDSAVTALERAYQKGDSGLVLSRNDPLLDPVRRDPRFEQLQVRLGFE
jgi:TolB-like protein/Tfp pilus assembly protein PilF